MTLLVEAQHVYVQFNDHTAVNDVSLSINKGEIVTLIGPNGAGKTTLVRAILGLTPITSGQLTKKPSLSIGYMPQKLQIDSTLPVTVNRFLGLASRKGGDIRSILYALAHKLIQTDLTQFINRRSLIRRDSHAVQER